MEATAEDIAELRRTMILCTEATLKALAILSADNGLSSLGGKPYRIEELVRNLPQP